MAVLKEQTEAYADGTNIKCIKLSGAVSALETTGMDANIFENMPSHASSIQTAALMGHSTNEGAPWPRRDEGDDIFGRVRLF